MSQPKPEKRGPKPRKAIPRVWAGGKRCRVPEPLRRFAELEKQADRLWSLIVRSRDGACERCHTRPVAHPHHLIFRSRSKRTRWLIQNGAAICAGCHLAVHRDSEDNIALAVKLLGREGWDNLNEMKFMGPKPDPAMAVVLLREEAKARGLVVP